MSTLHFRPAGCHRPGWIWPIKLTASPDDATYERHTTLDQKAHGDRSRVPTACRQPRKQSVLGRFVIKVEGLRIELTGKGFDLLLFDDMGSAHKALSDLEIMRLPAGITVNVVAPGLVETDMTKAITEKAQADWASAIPLGRLGTADDVAAAVCFLASDEAAYITGQVLAVNGGMDM